jgi:amidase
MTDITSLPATELVRCIAARTLSAREVAEAALARVAALDPAVNAVVTVNQSAIETAKAIDARLAAGTPARPLEGVPVLVKDNIETKGLRTTWGSRIHADHVPDEDAIVVERLKAAGAIVLGKSNTPEFAADPHTANLVFGTTRNPWDLMRTAGGSSGGTAAGIAAGFAPIGLGTDLGGSIRIPASFNGLVGIRPAPGRVPIYPSAYGWDTFVEHVVGPLATTVADAALMLSVLAGPDDRDPSSLPADGLDFVAAASPTSLVGKRIALTPDFGGIVPVDDTVRALAAKAANSFREFGCIVEEVSFDARDLGDIILGTRGFGVVARFKDLYAKHAAEMTAPLRGQIEAALAIDVETVARAERLRTLYWRRVAAFMATYDYIVAPSCGGLPFRLDAPLPTEVGGKPVARFYDVFRMTYATSVTGLPAVAVPAGFTPEGLPVGIQIHARRNREDLAIAAAAAYERAHPEHFRRPTIRPETAGPIPATLPSAGNMMASR